MRARCVMPTQTLPAASLRTAICLPAGRMLIRARNPLIYRVLWAIWRTISVVESIFLPESREAAGGGRRSAGQALRAGGDIVEGERHRDAGVKPHQADHVGDALMAECGDRAVVEPPSGIGRFPLSGLRYRRSLPSVGTGRPAPFTRWRRARSIPALRLRGPRAPFGEGHQGLPLRSSPERPGQMEKRR
jgi:hypothetical protein